eukprot:3718320-Alexandrium_andersonii.AAC.1
MLGDPQNPKNRTPTGTARWQRRAGSGAGCSPRAPLPLLLTGGATAPRAPPKSAPGECQMWFSGGSGGR